VGGVLAVKYDETAISPPLHKLGQLFVEGRVVDGCYMDSALDAACSTIITPKVHKDGTGP